MGYTVTTYIGDILKPKRIIAYIKCKDGTYEHLFLNKKLQINTLIELAKENEWEILSIREE